MNGVNLVVLVGTVGQDPKISSFTAKKDGKEFKKATFSVATNEKIGEKTETQWHNIEVVGAVAETIEKFVKKGTGISVTGKIKYEEYEKDGQKKNITKIILKEFSFVGGNKNSSTEGDREPVSTTTSPTKKAEKEVSAYTKTAPTSGSEAGFGYDDDGDLPF